MSKKSKKSPLVSELASVTELESSMIEKLSRGADESISKKEDEVLKLMQDSITVVTEIKNKQNQIKNSGKLGPDGLYPTLSLFEKSMLRNEILTLKKLKKNIKSQISSLNKELKAEYKKRRQKNIRGSLRISARQDSYHGRNKSSIEKGISNMVDSMEKDDHDSLVKQLADLVEPKKEEALLMRALLKAPRYLHTKVVANVNARSGYLQHFRSQLKKGKKK